LVGACNCLLLPGGLLFHCQVLPHGQGSTGGLLSLIEEVC
jgi:hypothetical protein